jgi:hypothetical protein
MAHELAPLVFHYRFRFNDGEAREFTVELHPETLALRAPELAAHPWWTRLGYFQCGNCPLQESRQPRCPIAVNLVEIVAFFKDRVSHDEAHVYVEALGRCYFKRVSLQEALSSLLGIYMVTSGCPVLDKLRPMVATHLPFMSSEESTYRMISMYLMAQLFIAREGGEPDWELHELAPLLEAARQANAGFCSRIKTLHVKDALLNALSILSALGEVTSLSIVDKDLGRWRKLFRGCFGSSAGQPALFAIPPAIGSLDE